MEHIRERKNLEESIEELTNQFRTTIIRQYNNEALENSAAEGKTRASAPFPLNYIFVNFVPKLVDVKIGTKIVKFKWVAIFFKKRFHGFVFGRVCFVSFVKN